MIFINLDEPPCLVFIKTDGRESFLKWTLLAALLPSVHLRLNSLPQIVKGETFQKRNAQRRIVHSLNEILLMDLEEQGVDREKDDRAKQILALRETLGLEPAVTGKLKGYAL